MEKPSRDNNYGCPDEIVDSIKRYVENGLEPGSFVRAVLENDLCTAVFQAHPLMLPHLRAVCMYVWWEIPSGCWGSKEKVEAWLGKGVPGEWITLRQRLQKAEAALMVAQKTIVDLEELHLADEQSIRNMKKLIEGKK